MRINHPVIMLALLGGCSAGAPDRNTANTTISDTNLAVNSGPATARAKQEEAAALQAEKAAPTEAAPASNWEYRTDRDEMRDSESRFATAQSENSIELDFPYGTVGARLIIRQRPQDGTSVMLSVDRGQIMCNSFSDDDYISMKFDDGPVRRFVCSGPDSGSSEIAFINSEQEVIAALKRSRRVMLEADFYNAGPRQFRFDTAGLRWPGGER